MDINELQTDAHALAVARGEWDPEPTFGDVIALVHSELSQAFEAYRTWELEPHVRCWNGARYDYHPANQICPPNHTGTKSQGVSVELADVMIRVADMAEHYGVDFASLDDYPAVKSRGTFGEWIAALHQIVSRALYWRESVELAPGSWEQCLRYAATGVESMAAHYGIDLDAAVAQRLGYYRMRLDITTSDAGLRQADRQATN